MATHRWSAHTSFRAPALYASLTSPRTGLLADYILITLGTSERTSEPIAIRFQDVRFEAVEQPDGSLAMDVLVWVGGTMVRTRSRGLFRQDSPKAERQKRWVRVPKFAGKVLSELVANHVPDPDRNPDDVLFTTERGRPRDASALGELLRMFRREFEPELLAIGVDAAHLTFRSLRKAVAAAVSDTAGIEVARDLLGHSDISITEGTTRSVPNSSSKSPPKRSTRCSRVLTPEPFGQSSRSI